MAEISVRTLHSESLDCGETHKSCCTAAVRHLPVGLRVEAKKVHSEKFAVSSFGKIRFNICCLFPRDQLREINETGF